MIFLNARGVALFLAASIALVTLASLTLIEETPNSALFLGAAMAFASSFLLIYVTFRFLIFNEINQIYEKMESLRGEEEEDATIDEEEDKNLESLSEISQRRAGLAFTPSPNPLRRVNQEITAYANAKQEEIKSLRQLERFRREFLADISHELKTPIFSAQGFILTLMDGAMEDEKVRDKFLKKAAKSLDSLNVIVEDLLTLSKIESGAIAMDYSVFDVRQLAFEVMEQLERKARKKKVNLCIQPSQTEENFYVQADFHRMGQVFTNLIHNGIKYGNEGGYVCVKFTRQEEDIHIVIEDNGPGISEEHLGRIFERFYRIEKSRSKKQGGTGLGLAIVKHIVRRHDAEISVKSSLNKGTSFSFALRAGNPDLAVNQIALDTDEKIQL